MLPSDVSGLDETISCFKIEPYESYPGFIRLRICGDMNYNWQLKKYEFNYTAYSNSYAAINLDIAAEM